MNSSRNVLATYHETLSHTKEIYEENMRNMIFEFEKSTTKIIRQFSRALNTEAKKLEDAVHYTNV